LQTGDSNHAPSRLEKRGTNRLADQPVAIGGRRRVYENGNQRMTNLRNFWFRASVTLLVVGFAILFIPPYKHYCEFTNTNNIYCGPYEIFSFFGASR
jgi:hypothetical protein